MKEADLTTLLPKPSFFLIRFFFELLLFFSFQLCAIWSLILSVCYQPWRVLCSLERISNCYDQPNLVSKLLLFLSSNWTFIQGALWTAKVNTFSIRGAIIWFGILENRMILFPRLHFWGLLRSPDGRALCTREKDWFWLYQIDLPFLTQIIRSETSCGDHISSFGTPFCAKFATEI